MNKIKNPNYDKELKIYNEKAKALNHELANEETWFEYDGGYHKRTKNITPYQKYKELNIHFRHNVITNVIATVLLFIATICVITIFWLDEPISWILLAFFTPIIPHFFISLWRLSSAKKVWEKVLEEHNIIKPIKYFDKNHPTV